MTTCLASAAFHWIVQMTTTMALNVQPLPHSFSTLRDWHVTGDSGLWTVYLRLKNKKMYRTRSLAWQQKGWIQLDYEFLYELFKESGVRPIVRQISESKRAPDAHLYLDGLKWLLDMYSKGICPDYR